MSIGDDGIADVRVIRDAKQILVIGKTIGRTDIRVWLRSGEQFSHLVRVIDEPLGDKLARVNELLGEIEGVRAAISGDQIVIEGQTLTEEEITDFCKRLPRYKRPRKIIFGEVPRSPTGKIEKPKLRKTYTGISQKIRQPE